MLRKLGIASCSIMLKPIGADIQAFSTGIVIFIAICVQLHIRPYLHGRMNFIETFGLCTIYSTIFLGLFQSSANLELGQSEAISTGFGVIIVLINAFFLMFIFAQLFVVTYQATRKVGGVKKALLILSFGNTAESSRNIQVRDNGEDVPSGNPVFNGEKVSAQPSVQDVYQSNVDAGESEYSRPV